MSNFMHTGYLYDFMFVEDYDEPSGYGIRLDATVFKSKLMSSSIFLVVPQLIFIRELRNSW